MTESETITERKEGVTVHVETKRGTGTRDQDKVSLTAHYDSLLNALQERENRHELIAEEARRLRSIQPENDTEEADK